MVIVLAVVLAAMLVALSVFQIALVCGAPLGKVAWGGNHSILPLRLRFAALSATLRYLFIGFIAFDRAGLTTVLPAEFTFWVMWLIVIHLGFSFVLSLFSASFYEKLILAPYTLAMGVLSLMIAWL